MAIRNDKDNREINATNKHIMGWEIDYLNEEYELEFEKSDEYETLGGFILDELEEIPAVGATFIIKNLRFVIEEVSERRIELVRVFVID